MSDKEFEKESKKQVGKKLKRINPKFDKIQDDIIYKIIIDSNMLSIKQIDLLNRDNLVLTTFLTLSYNFNIPLTGSLFKFDKEKFKDYILIED